MVAGGRAIVWRENPDDSVMTSSGDTPAAAAAGRLRESKSESEHLRESSS